MNIATRVEEKTKEIDEILSRYLPKEQGQQKIILEAVNYSLLAGGKRIRPMIILETYRMFKDPNHANEEAMIEPFLVAMEMIHTYSLVHDDLPAMDNDEYRRGKLTTHAAFGEAMGILAGDALLNLAFETALTSFQVMEEKLPQADWIMYYQCLIRATQVLAKNAGVYGMIGGQVVDVLNDNTPLSKEQLDFIYDLKTGALLRSSFLIGAILAGVKEDKLKIIEKIAYNVGLAFQIQDDILDVTSTQEVLGKPIHSDEKNHKTTYVTLYGINESKTMVSKLSQEALSLLAELRVENDFMAGLIEFLITREK
jgi:geranylgeranyl diphosphate synthase type II